MHEVELNPWHSQSSQALWDGGLGHGFGAAHDLVLAMQQPGGESRLRAAVEPELGTGLDLSDDALVARALLLLDQGRLVMESSLAASLPVDPHYPIGESSQDLGNLIDLMAYDDGADETDEPTRPTWIEIAVVDGQGQPIRGRAYRLRLPDGTVRSGTLGDQGIIRFDDVDPGECTLELLDHDPAEWAPPAMAA